MTLGNPSCRNVIATAGKMIHSTNSGTRNLFPMRIHSQQSTASTTTAALVWALADSLHCNTALPIDNPNYTMIGHMLTILIHHNTSSSMSGNLQQ